DAVVVTPGGEKASLVALHKSSGEVIWKAAVPTANKGGDTAPYSSPVVAEVGGKREYVQFLQTGVVGVDAKTGDFLWRYDATGLGKWKSKGGPGSVLYADGRIYVHHENNQVALVEATGDEFREKGRFTPPNAPKHTVRGEQAWAYPSLADGKLYVRDVGTLW